MVGWSMHSIGEPLMRVKASLGINRATFDRRCILRTAPLSMRRRSHAITWLDLVKKVRPIRDADWNVNQRARRSY